MEHISETDNKQIVFVRRYIKDGRPTISSTVYLPIGKAAELEHFEYQKRLEESINVQELYPLGFGRAYLINRFIKELIRHPVDHIRYPENTNVCTQVYLYDHGESMSLDDDGCALPCFVSYGAELFISGQPLTSLLERIEDDPSRSLCGKDYLEAFFDVAILEGYETPALHLIYSLCKEKGEDIVFEETKWFLRSLFREQNFFEMSPLFEARMEEISDTFRERLGNIEKTIPVEVAALSHLEIFELIGLEGYVDAYLQDLADSDDYPLACYIFADRLWDKGVKKLAYEYARKGAELGQKDCSYLAAKISLLCEFFEDAKYYLELGMKQGSPECFAAYAEALIKYRKDGDDHPFHRETPMLDAFKYATIGVSMHSSKAMVVLARLILDFGDGSNEACGLQLLERAMALGEKEAIYRLAIYYSNEHKDGPGRDLVYAESLIKRAMLEEAYDLRMCQIVYADILMNQGEIEKGIKMIEEQAKKKHGPSMVFLGELVTGIDPRYPHPTHHLPEAYLHTVIHGEEFFKATLWEAYPEIITAQEAAKILGKLAKDGEYAAFYELARIYRYGPKEVIDEKKAKYFDACVAKYLN